MRERVFLEHIDAARISAWVGQDEERAATIATLCRTSGERLDPIARELIIRFGAHSWPAKELRARAGSNEQAAFALGWAKDAHPDVRLWAEEVAAGERDAAARDLAEREFYRRHG